MAQFNLSTASAVFKRKYGKLADNVYNSANVTTSQIKKSYDFTGDGLYMAIPLSFSGGVGTGTLPTPGVATYDQAIVTAKSVYGTVEIKREAIKASANDEGSFVRGLKHAVAKTVESYSRNDSRMFYGNGDGSLGVVSIAVTGSNPYVLGFTAGNFNEANFEENDIVNIETGNTDPFRIDSVEPQSDGTLDVTVTRLSGSQVPVSTDEVFMQNSEDNDVVGLGLVTDATSGSLYDVTVARRWKSTQVDASSTTLDIALMNTTMLEIERKTGKTPDRIFCSYVQFNKLITLLEDAKRYPIAPRYGSEKLKAAISWSGVEFMSTMGPVPILPERFCPADRIYFLNTSLIHRYHRPDFGWFDDDGTVFLRTSEDAYAARYGGYYQNYIEPQGQGRIDALAV